MPGPGTSFVMRNTRSKNLMVTVLMINYYYYYYHLHHHLMRGIYTYIPETNYVRREYSVAAILLLLFMVLISLVPVLNLLHFYISTFRSMCAVPNVAVFCSSFTSCFPGMLLTYFLNDFETVPVAPIITGITFVFTFHMRCISLLLLLLLHKVYPRTGHEDPKGE